MRMIAAGKRPKDIASDLALSPKSISAYRSRILEKMGMKTNAELIRYAITNRLL
jgi:two-component system invasion response regulator UvrY